MAIGVNRPSTVLPQATQGLPASKPLTPSKVGPTPAPTEARTGTPSGRDAFEATPSGGSRTVRTQGAQSALEALSPQGRSFNEADFNQLMELRAGQDVRVASAGGTLPVPTRGLRPGEQGPHVRLFQSYLEVYTQQRLPSGADGVYGGETQALVRRFQEINRLPQDGIAGEQTLRRMGFLQPPTRVVVESSAVEPTVDQLMFLVSKQLGWGNHEEMKGWLQNTLANAGIPVRHHGDTDRDGGFEFSVDIPTPAFAYLDFEYRRLTGQERPADGSAPRVQVEDGVRANTPRSPTQSAPLSATQGQAVLRTWEGANGQPVRAQYADGSQAVLARDSTGRIHTFPDTPFNEPLPMTGATFERIPAWRQTQLRNAGYELINRHGEGQVGTSQPPNLDFRDFGRLLNDLAARKDMTELEKAYTWTFIADAKGQATMDWRGFLDGQYDISLDGMPEAVADSQPLRRSNSPNHIVLGFTDGYHAPLGNLSPEDALAKIRGHESVNVPLVGPVNINPGDTEASRRTGEAFRAFRERGFAGFAEVWNRNFVEP